MSSAGGSYSLHVGFKLVWILEMACIACAVGHVRTGRSPQNIVARTGFCTFRVDALVESPCIILCLLWFFDIEAMLWIRHYFLLVSEIFFAAILQQDTSFKGFCLLLDLFPDIHCPLLDVPLF